MKDLRNKGKLGWKSITLITSLSIIGALLLAIIVMVIVPVKYIPVYNKASIGTVQIITSTTEQALDSDTDSEKFKQIMTKFEKSLRTNSLNALFNGTLGKSVNPKFSSGTAGSLDKLKSESEYLLKFNFKDEQTLKNADGSVFKGTGTSVKYTNMYVSLNKDSNNFVRVNVCFGDGPTNISSYIVESYGNLYGLYDIVHEYMKDR